MKKMEFTKMVASGNDFVIAEFRNQKSETRYLKNLAKKICDRKYGVGADGLLILKKSKLADVKMLIFNPDGSQPDMCGNGARCVALYSARSQKPEIRSQKEISIETKAGIIESKLNSDNVKVKLTNPKDIKLNISIKVNNRPLRVNFIHIGVPHTVIFAESLDKIDVLNIGRRIRYHPRFAPQGTNVDFVEILSKNSIGVRTYERGVEEETLACGTGAVASALITSYKLPITSYDKINVHTKSKEILKVFFNKISNKFNNVWLEGKAREAYKGEYHV